LTAIEVTNLTKTYPPDLTAVDNISFKVDDGEIFGLLGPNGAGKTTAIKMIMGLTRPTSGSIWICGIDALSHASQVRQLMGYVPQAISADGDLTGYENLLIFSKLFYVQKKDRDVRIKEALAEMELTDRANDLVKHYSGGMMRRLEIGEAVVSRPRVLFLDEPSIGLDPSSKRQVWKHIRRLNKELNMTVLITTHDMAEADELCDRITIMNQGRLWPPALRQN
jgi:ABC-2 type transport system ATP-binding protein